MYDTTDSLHDTYANDTSHASETKRTSTSGGFGKENAKRRTNRRRTCAHFSFQPLRLVVVVRAFFNISIPRRDRVVASLCAAAWSKARSCAVLKE